MNFSDKDVENLTPLHIASKESNKMAIEILLEADADLNVKDAHGTTPLDWAVKKGYTKCIETLILYTLLRDVNAEKPDCVLKNSNISKYWSSFQDMANVDRVKMRHEKIDGSNVTLGYFLFIKDENSLADFVSNKYTNMQECLKESENIKKWQDAFPFYSYHMERIIEAQLNKGMERKGSLDILAELLRQYGSDKNRLDKVIKTIMSVAPQYSGKIINPLKEQTDPLTMLTNVDIKSFRELPRLMFSIVTKPFTMLTNVEIATVKKAMIC